MNNKHRFCIYFLLSVYVYTCIFYFFYSMRHKFRKAKEVHDIKYVFIYNGTKNDELSPKLCPTNNCLFTTNLNVFEANENNFHAVVFREGILTSPFVPKKRTNSQMYIFYTLKSSFTYPACESYSDSFFNWTYTYRLDSNLIASYFVVTNRTGHVVAPSKSVLWSTSYINSKIAITGRIQNILSTKKKAVAWIINVCKPDNKKTQLLTSLQRFLSQFSLQVDLYGSCVQRECDYHDCDAMIMRDYYFYIAFEEISVADFVSEEVMVAYNNYAIPIVFGAANYTWFLPPQSYLDSMQMNPYEVAWAIRVAMTSSVFHQNYFRWTNLYTINSNSPRNLLCNLCDALNDPKAKHAPVIENFRKWWNTPIGEMWCKTVYKNKTLMLNDRLRHNRHITKLISIQTSETVIKINQFSTQKPPTDDKTNSFSTHKSQTDNETHPFLTHKLEADDETNLFLTEKRSTDYVKLFSTHKPKTLETHTTTKNKTVVTNNNKKKQRLSTNDT